MKIFSGIFEKSNQTKNGIISIGVFDSFHRGHQALLHDLVALSKKEGLETFVLTFRIPPRKDTQLNVLELNDKLSFIENTGVENVILCDFDEYFSNLNGFEFVRLLEKNFNITNYYIGEDFRFGFNKTGSKELIEKSGYKVFLEETFKIDNKKVSTSQIKKYIKDGTLEGIEQCLGRHYYIKGIVKMGKQLGRTIGYPTMNIINSEVLYPLNGAYISITEINGINYKSMTFVDSSIIETHLIGYEKFEYNFSIKVNFVKKLRNNISFKTLDLLKIQLESDLLATKQFFNI